MHPLTLLSDNQLKLIVFIIYLTVFIILCDYMPPYIMNHNYTYSYEYDTQVLKDGLLTSCNMCTYTYNNKLYNCPQNSANDCVPYNTTCGVIIDAVTGHCNDFDLHKITHDHKTFNWFAIGVSICMFAYIALETNYSISNAILHYKHQLEERNSYQTIIELHATQPIATTV